VTVREGFPRNFVWGAASSAYQIEGAADQRGQSVWDAFCERQGAIRDGYTGRIACDHYHRLEEDLDLIAALGVGAYRFSVSWPRVLATGTGHVDPSGVAFYDRLVDGLLERGTVPWVTLFHWDFPLELLYRGGWLNRDSAQWFAEYAGAVVDALSDRVLHWITLNEPQCFIGLGHYRAVHAPGIQYPRAELLLAAHHCLLAHGMAVEEIRARAKRIPTIGWSPVAWVAYPADNKPDSIAAARELMFTIDDGSRLWPMNNSWYSDPVVLGEYPEQGLELFGADAPKVRPGDLDIISTPIDFYGVNIYHGIPITFPVAATAGRKVTAPARAAGYPETPMGWTVDPEALYWGPRFLAERYRLPIYITENGIASMDWVHADGHVHDPARIDYLARHLIALRRAIADGVDVRGYFHWSIMDNFEWELGYSKRFGLAYVDYESLTRIPKDSYAWYGDVIASSGRSLPDTVAPLR
jgi:beta-glucosidase